MKNLPFLLISSLYQKPATSHSLKWKVVGFARHFFSGLQKSTMYCKVYSWDKEITDTLDASCFIWHRNSSDVEADKEWDKNHIGMKQITITTEDVYDNASFYCEVKI